MRKTSLEQLEDRRLLSITAWSAENVALAEDSNSQGALVADVNGASQGRASRADAPEFVLGEILVGFEGEVPAAYRANGAQAALKAAENAVGANGLHSPRVLMDLPATANRAARLATHWQLPAGADVLQTVAQLTGRPGIAYAEPNYIQYADATPNDPDFDQLWGLHNTGQTGGADDADIDGPEAWDITTGSGSIVVGVIDTGVDYTHEDLFDNMWVNAAESAGTDGIDDDGNGWIDDIYGWDFYNNDSDPFDDNGHGSHTSGTIGAVGNNGVGVVGVNWDVQIMALKFLSAGGSGPTDAAVEAVDYARTMGAQLTSNSWGGGGFSQALYDAIEASGAADMLFIASAGNSNRDADASPSYPAAYDVDSIISVAATDDKDARASFSNWGLTTVDLAAPGVSVLSTTPGNTYGTKSGTSMAAPHVAGVAALAWGLAPSAPYAEIKAAILDGADPVAAFDPAGSTPTLTGGRLNARRTLEFVGMAVAGSNPASGSMYVAPDPADPQPPTHFVIDFSYPYDPTTVAASDLTVNGTAAGSVIQTDADTLTFHFAATPVTAEGVQTMHMAYGAVATASGVPDDKNLIEWTANFRYDALELAVVDPTVPPAGPVVALPFHTLLLNFNERLHPDTPAYISRGTVNLTQMPGVTVNVSSFDPPWPPARAVDGNLNTSWFTALGDAANLGTTPFLEVVLPTDATVSELRMFGNREWANGYDFFEGIFQLFDDSGNELFTSEEVLLPAPDRDVTLPIPDVAGVRRVRFTGTDDESNSPGFAELEVFGPGNLLLSHGSVQSAEGIDADGDGYFEAVLYTLDITSENADGTLTVTMPAGTLSDEFGNPNAQFQASYVLDWVGPVAFPKPLEPVAPLGSLIYEASVVGSIIADDTGDILTIDVDAGQTMTVVVDPHENLEPIVNLSGPGGVNATDSAGAGQDAVIQTAGPTRLGASGENTYTITVGGVGSSTGAYTLQVILNAAVEQEPNDSTGVPQDISRTFIDLLPGVEGSPTRGAVLGAVKATLNPDIGPPIEDFEHQDMGLYVEVGKELSNASITTAAAHDDDQEPPAYGLADRSNFGFGGWIYRDDAQVQVEQGDVISVWIKSEDTLTGRGYFGFGATPAGTLSVQMAPNTDELLLGFHRNYKYKTIGAVAQTWLADHWYRMEVTWDIGGDITGRLYDSDGTTLLNTVFGNNNVITSGGIAFRSFESTKDFDTVQVLKGGAGSDVYLSIPDVYSFNLDTGERATLALTALDSGNVDLEFWDGTSWIPGSTSASNVDEVIQFAGGSEGTYYARVTGGGVEGVQYSLVVTGDAHFDLEPNSGLAPWLGDPAQSIQLSSSAVVLGNIGGDPEVDFFAVTLAEGDVLDLSTLTPAGETGEFENDLDPMLRLYDSLGNVAASDDNSGGEDRNAALSFTALAAGTYYIEVTPSDATGDPTRGEYVLTIDVTEAPPSPGIAINKTSVVTEESGVSDTFTVVLSTAPTNTVTIAVSSSNMDEGTVSPTELVFSTDSGVVGGWDVPQTVTVTGQDDDVVDGDIAYTIVTAAAVSVDSDYGGMNAADVSATNLDNETPAGVTVDDIDPDTMSPGTSVNVEISGLGFAAGASVTFTGGAGPAPKASNIVVVDGTSITATVTAHKKAKASAWDVVVTNLDSSTASLPGAFTVETAGATGSISEPSTGSSSRASSAAAFDAALLAWVDLDSSDGKDTDPLATQVADELALMMME